MDVSGSSLKNKKILIAINLDEGLYNFRAELIEALLAEGAIVHLALPYGEYRDKLTEMGCILHPTPMDRRGTNPIGELALIANYNRILTEVSPSAVLTYTIKPNIYMGWLCNIRHIPYIPTVTGLGTAVSGEGLLQSFTKLLYKQAMKGAHRVFFQNETNEELFERLGIALGRHSLLPGSGVNIERFSLLPYPEGEEIGFLFISRIMEEKGIGEYIEAASVIRAKYPQATFRVLGFMESDYAGVDDFQRAVDAGIIIYEGSVTDVREYLKNAECTVHPSYYPEGMSNVCLESAASGRAVITTDRPGCSDTVRDGVSGIVVSERNARELADAIERFILMDREERKAMGLAGRGYMEERFDRRIVSERMIETLKCI